MLSRLVSIICPHVVLPTNLEPTSIASNSHMVCRPSESPPGGGGGGIQPHAYRPRDPRERRHQRSHFAGLRDYPERWLSRSRSHLRDGRHSGRRRVLPPPADKTTLQGTPLVGIVFSIVILRVGLRRNDDRYYNSRYGSRPSARSITGLSGKRMTGLPAAAATVAPAGDADLQIYVNRSTTSKADDADGHELYTFSTAAAV